MANTSSAKKCARKSERRTEINKNNRTRVRTFIKKVETAIESKDSGAARDAFVAAQPIIHSSVTKGLLHKNTAARKLSRLSSRIKALG